MLTENSKKLKLPLISGAVKGGIAFYLYRLLKKGEESLLICENDKEILYFQKLFSFIDEDASVLSFPSWDTVPYDRNSPKKEIVAERIETLLKIKELQKEGKGFILLTNVSALIQKCVPISFFEKASFILQKGKEVDLKGLKLFLASFGYEAVDKVFSEGEFSFRGNIIDIFPTGFKSPIRMDLFGDEIESLKTFDALTQRSLEETPEVMLFPVSEILMNKETLKHFRMKYRELFGVPKEQDEFYGALSEGISIAGGEHFLPLFFPKMVSFLDYLEKGRIKAYTSTSLDETVDFHWDEINEYYEQRKIAREHPSKMEGVYNPIPPNLFFFSKEEVISQLEERETKEFSSFEVEKTKSLKSKIAPVFATGRVSQKEGNVFKEVADFISKASQKVIVCAYSKESQERIIGGLFPFLPEIKKAFTFHQAFQKAPSVVVFPLENGFIEEKVIFISEGDIFGEKIQNASFTKKRGKKEFIGDISTLSQGDLIVHQSHGIGQYIGLKNINIAGESHDCIALLYAKGDKLFIPIENMDVLNKYGQERQGIALDTLGTQGWEARKGKLKKYILEIAQKLIDLEAKRKLKTVSKIYPETGFYDDFCGRFPYVETHDQKTAIYDVLEDLSKGVPMDRLVCGDVGFGKTEVALRASFVAAMEGGQVALIVPTTLLARQHYLEFKRRFEGFPLRVEMLSRLVTPTKARQVKKEITAGVTNIVIGTHALLSKNVSFKNLNLLIVDEEHNFGVIHKEKLKELKEGVHILTLTATPIPRTLQMALTGVRELSLIATPPVDRLAVKTFIMPFDKVIIKEAILRELSREGQAFYVCPRISDIAGIYKELEELLPDLRIAVAHGQMKTTDLERVMSDFFDRKYDLLLSTTIIESGIDMPNVNTLIIHRADKFGLAQLYQLKGRVGRSKARGYCYLTIPPYRKVGVLAERRLSVMQSLDSLGAGFSLASHDLDIRGAGNLLGEEQSGHIQEVGIELYQKMLQEAIFSLREGKKEEVEEFYSPQISLDIPVMIPEDYLPDLSLRMELYHRISSLETKEEAQDLKEEMVDRFGALPESALNLFEIVELKILAKIAHVEKVDVGPKGAVISFYQKVFPKPALLIEFIQNQLGTVKLNSNYKLTILRSWNTPKERLIGIRKFLRRLSEMALS
ncbi:MAG: transcription-repair coupling factor [Alphaproteobacteria bacterium]|nr:transcription-repair coupling factor [Alphaproteobacteria bacterium]